MRFKKVSLKTWDEIYAHYHSLCDSGGKESDRIALDPSKYPRWVFRGQKGNEKEGEDIPRTSLERAVTITYRELSRANNLEKNIFEEFKRRAYQYQVPLPQGKTTLEWLSLMRHFEAPVRLLDCSYSFFVALFFSVDSDGYWDRRQSKHVVWAIDANACRGAANRHLCERHSSLKAVLERAAYQDLFRPNEEGKCAAEFDKYLMSWDDRQPTRLVYPVTPFRLNERLTIQQGTFMCPGDVGISFWENLEELDLPQRAIRKIVVRLTPEERRRVLHHLARMNMDRATLFPDFQGFAQSLNTRLSMYWHGLPTQYRGSR